MNEEYVFVARYAHRHGTDVRVFRKKEGAVEWANDIARTYWNDYYPDVPTPKKDIGFEYFKGMSEFHEAEYFEIEQQVIEEA
jgi:hypothetical protein